MSVSAVIVCIFAVLVSFVLGWFLSKQINYKLQARLEDELRQQAEKIENLVPLQSENENLQAQFQ